jgi:Sap, sulfolipid-1-addressing protein
MMAAATTRTAGGNPRLDRAESRGASDCAREALAFNLVMFALIETPLIGFVFAPDRTRAFVGKLDNWLGHHSRTIVTAVAGAIGPLPTHRRTRRPELT